MQGIDRLAREHGAVLVGHDIQTGCRCAGSFFSSDDMDVAPRLVALAESFSGRVTPFAALLLRPEQDICPRRA